MLESPAQLRAGPHQGGVAGWLDSEGRPEFLYLEIAGYYLTAAAWIASRVASSDVRRAKALENGRAAVAWVRSVTAGEALPPTRLYLAPGREDWRNQATFVFDLAMAARGVACFATVAPDPHVRAVVENLAFRLNAMSAGRELLPSHAPREGSAASMPVRWSTLPGPHHAKAAAAILALPADVLNRDLVETCRTTISHWAASLEGPSWPTRELHPLLYGVEGLLIRNGASNETLNCAERFYERLLQLQVEDGSMPSATAGPPAVRSDVLAQALRVGALLRAAGRLSGNRWEERLGALAAALLRHVREDGGVLFATDQDVANTWCAMFTHQALVLQARAMSGALSSQESAWLV